ncbi:ABC transporter substrate-binding protein [Mesorhizobium sp. Cs1299R1N1]|uniref:ABC transporter substrate-binding protein n=1 Tax=Mesorhizobium sp. Cs1299R1N1 TaxID=3015172 RepID=UPI00301BF1CA
MRVTRRELVKLGLAAGTALSVPSVLRAQTSQNSDRTVRMVLGAFQVFDPVVSATDDTVNHATAIYDTLFARDSKLVPQPQMVGEWNVSDDRKTYTFQLRDGLTWHDGTSVTAADCVASIRRWSEVAPGGKLLKVRAREISKKDDKTFTIVLNAPIGTLLEILAGPFMMREKDASLPATEQVTANIGSGPFRFNHALAKPGSSFTYDRNEKYVSRKEPSDGLAGGKVVKVDRVVAEMGLAGNQQTALAALQAGEVDFLSTTSSDLLPLIESDPNLELQIMDRLGQDMFARMNCLQKPFDNVKARQAMLHLIDQEAFLKVTAPDPRFGRTVTSMFGNETPVSNDENTGWFKKGGDPEKAKQLFKEAGYAGEKIVILQSSDWAEASNAALLLAAELRKIGVNAELAPSDWAGVVARRGNKGPVEDGGWSIFITSTTESTLSTVITEVTLPMNGDQAWFGWPKHDEYEALRTQWSDVETLEERKALARKMQQIWWDYVPEILLGQIVSPSVRRKTLIGLVEAPSVFPMWNMHKA